MRRVAHLLLQMLLLTALPGCDQHQSNNDEATALSISGQASYQVERSDSISYGSELILRLENLAVLPDKNAVIAEKITQLKQQSQPLRFQMRVFRDQLMPDTPYALRVMLKTSGDQIWTSESLALIDPDKTEIRLGNLILLPTFAENQDDSILFSCGSKTVIAHFQDRLLQLQINDDRIHLKQTSAASGARYQSADGEVTFWNKGSEARLTMSSVEWPTCNLVSEDILALFPFKAHGNEPGWSLSANVEEVVLDWNYGQQKLVMPYPQLDLTSSGFVLHSQANSRLLKVNVLNSLCRDSMSGKPFPQHVEVQYGDKYLSGCGGNSHALLTGEEWVVEDMDDSGIIDSSRITLKFDAKGRLSGLASCNQYSTTYEFNEQIDIAPAIATRKACAPALMAQESRFLTLLSQVTRLDFDDKGALLLSSADGSTITARR